jgi:glycosyltransferase involved in cell wall biosynthesis
MPKKRRIKILRIQSRICIGGPAVHTEMLSRYMPGDRYESVVVGGAVDMHESCRADDLKRKGVDVRILDDMKRSLAVLRDLKSIYKIYRMIMREKPDIVETHTAKAGATGRIAAFLAGVPVIIHTFHGHVFDGYFGPFVTQAILLIEKVLACITTQIVVLSEKQRHDIAMKYRIAPSKKVKLIPLGFELDRFLSLHRNGHLRKELGVSSDAKLIAIIGRIVPIKNHEMMLRVMEKLNEGKMEVHLAVVGDGELKNTIVKAGNRKYIHFLGWRSDLEYIYSGIDLLALTSLNEGTPLAIIEAMASGVPVVSTAVGGVPDIVVDGENGFTCEANDDEEMYKKIESILMNKELNSTFISNARKRVIERYMYQRLIKDMDELYQNVLSDTTS